MNNVREVKLDDLAYEVSDRVDNPSESGYERFVGLEHLDSGSFYVKRWGNTSDVKSSMKLFKKGDILFARRNTYLKRASIADFDGVCSGDIIVLRENDTTVKGITLLIMNLEKFWDFAISNSAGTMSKRAKWRDIGNFNLIIKGSETKIVNTMLSLEDTIKQKEEFLEKLRIYKHTFINNAIIIKGSKNKLDDIIESVTEKYNPIKDEEIYRCIELEHISQVTGKVLGTIPAEQQKSIKNKFRTSDVLFGKLRPYLKKYALPNFDGVCSSEILVLRSKDEKQISNKFIFYLVQSNKFQKIANITKGTKMPRADWKELRKHSFNIPDIETQKLIISKIESIERSIDELERNINDTQTLKEILLEQLIG